MSRSTSAAHALSSIVPPQVINVTLMVVIGTLACQDDEVDAAIATPQVTHTAGTHQRNCSVTVKPFEDCRQSFTSTGNFLPTPGTNF